MVDDVRKRPVMPPKPRRRTMPLRRRVVAGGARLQPGVRSRAERRKETRCGRPAKRKAKSSISFSGWRRRPSKAARAKRRPWLLISLAACVRSRQFVAALFYLFIASDRYVSKAPLPSATAKARRWTRLACSRACRARRTSRTPTSSPTIVVSRDMVQELERRLPFRDVIRERRLLQPPLPDATLEDLVEYWESYVDVYYDSTKNTVIVEVQAFAAAGRRPDRARDRRDRPQPGERSVGAGAA